ncbi:6-pyruvoyl tetrahydropterin synthase family protein [Myceligenerans crystallogenes]
MLRITKEFHFSASHVIEGLPTWHPCARMHGHNYVVALELSARKEDLKGPGFVRDYRELDAFKRWIDDTLDHRHLNEAMNEAMGGGSAPTAENLCTWIFDLWKTRLPELTAVRVDETPKTSAVYRPGER